MTEGDITVELKKFFPKLERIENSVKVGTPDVLLPLPTGWQMIELKVEHNGYLYFQKTQLAFMADRLGLPKPCQAEVLAKVKSQYYLMTAKEVLNRPREAATTQMVKIMAPTNAYVDTLRNVLIHRGYLEVL